MSLLRVVTPRGVRDGAGSDSLRVLRPGHPAVRWRWWSSLLTGRHGFTERLQCRSGGSPGRMGHQEGRHLGAGLSVFPLQRKFVGQRLAAWWLEVVVFLGPPYSPARLVSPAVSRRSSMTSSARLGSAAGLSSSVRMYSVPMLRSLVGAVFFVHCSRGFCPFAGFGAAPARASRRPEERQRGGRPATGKAGPDLDGDPARPCTC